MPGPGPHLMYAMGSGLCLTSISNGRFSPHHTLFYTINAFFGPDVGSFTEWLGSLFGGSAHAFGSALEDLTHHPLFYILLLGLPLSFLYSRISSYLLHTQLLDSVSRVGLSLFFVSSVVENSGFTGLLINCVAGAPYEDAMLFIDFSWLFYPLLSWSSVWGNMCHFF